MPAVSAVDLDEMMNKAVHPTVEELRKRGVDYRGVLFAGFMITADGPKLLEFNVRFGDPEAQVILPRFEGDLAETLFQVANGDLRIRPTLSNDAMVAVVLASQGYPTAPKTGDVIYGLEQAKEIEGVNVFCAGVSSNSRGELVTGGGRVLNVCGRAAKLEAARELAYKAVSFISWTGMQHRTDIGASIGIAPGKEEVT
jgi:phosphoribosylamine--glycine ligase